MSRWFTRVNPDAMRRYARVGGAEVPVVTAAPFSVSLWIYPDIAINQTVWWCGDSGVGAHYWRIQLRSASAGQTVRFQGTVIGPGSAETTTQYVARTWHHVLATEIAIDNRHVWLDGGGHGANADARTPLNVDRTTIGQGDQLVSNQPFTGLLGHVAIWNIGMSVRCAGQLAAGFDPRKLEPDSLISYAPLNGWAAASEIDVFDHDHVFTDIGGAATTIEPEPPIPNSIVAP